MMHRAAIVACLMALAISTGIGPARAHTALTASDPAADAALVASPTAITLTFNESIDTEFATIAVTDSDGKQQAIGTPSVRDAQVTAPVSTALPGGAYTVAYRVISDDGHPVTGSYQFSITTTGNTPAPATSTTAASAPPESTAAAKEEQPGGSGLWWLFAAACGGLFVGGVVVVVRRFGKSRNPQQ